MVTVVSREVAARVGWPLWGLAAVGLIESRGFVTTPEISDADMRSLPPTIVDEFSAHKGDLLVGGGLSLLGVFCIVVFVTCLSRELAARLPSHSSLPWIALAGGSVTGGATVLGYSDLALTAQAVDQRVPAATLAAVQAATDGLAYAAFTAMALVTGAVALAGIRSRAVQRWLAAFSAVVTVALLAGAFLPFVSWFPALVWTLVTSIAMLVTARRPTGLVADDAPAQVG